MNLFIRKAVIRLRLFSCYALSPSAVTRGELSPDAAVRAEEMYKDKCHLNVHLFHDDDERMKWASEAVASFSRIVGVFLSGHRRIEAWKKQQ